MESRLPWGFLSTLKLRMWRNKPIQSCVLEALPFIPGLFLFLWFSRFSGAPELPREIKGVCSSCTLSLRHMLARCFCRTLMVYLPCIKWETFVNRDTVDLGYTGNALHPVLPPTFPMGPSLSHWHPALVSWYETYISSGPGNCSYFMVQILQG